MNSETQHARRLGRRAPLLVAAALVAGVAACDLKPEQAPPFQPTGSGAINGMLFYDTDGDGRFDPLRGDVTLDQATVRLSQRGDSASVIATTTTDANGNFALANVPVGSHEIRATIPGDSLVVCVPVPVTVNVSEQAYASTPARLSCRIDISVAEAKSTGATVTVGGIVTAAPGVYRANNLYLQDATGGMQAFNVPGGTSSGIAEGDSVELKGPISPFNQEIQISPVNSFRIYTRGRPVVARQYTIRQIRDAYAASGNKARPIGELVVVRRVQVHGLPAVPNGTPGSGGTDARVVQGTDSIAFRLDQAQNTQEQINAYDAAKCYDITGILGIFGSTLQLKPRRVSDRVEVSCSAQ